MTTGLLVMAHGTPADPAGIAPFYTRIRRGVPPSEAQLADLVRRYEAIGGTSPLTERTRRQVDALAAVLEDEEPGRWVVAFGAKHTDPSIESAAATLVARGVSSVVGLVLTPHRADRGSGEYHARAAAALEGTVAYTAVTEWYAEEGFVDLMADRVLDAVGSLQRRGVDVEAPAGHRVPVVCTAHSVPVRALADGDPYPEQVEESAALVAAAAELDDVLVAYQSAGRTPDPWLGPSLEETLDRLAAEGVDAVVVCPIGFVADHLEVLYDLDIEARARAESLGLAFARTASLNDDPRLVAALARTVRRAAGPSGP